MQATTVREALRASLAGTFGTVLSVLPRLIVFAIALAVGWAISSLLARGTVAVLRAVRFDEMARRSGLARFIRHMGVQDDPTATLASVAKWLVRLLTLVVALDALGLPAGSGVLHQLLLWLPNLAVGLVALVIGSVAATALSRLVRGSATVAGLRDPEVLATATGVAVWAFAIVLAASQLGIATSLVDLGLVGVVGGIALAAGLAFGWAGRERAAQILSFFDRGSPTVTAPSATATSPEPAPDIPASSASAVSGTSASSAEAAPGISTPSPDSPPPASVSPAGTVSMTPAPSSAAPAGGMTESVLAASEQVLDASEPFVDASDQIFEGSEPMQDEYAPVDHEYAAPRDEHTPGHEEYAPLPDDYARVLDEYGPGLDEYGAGLDERAPVHDASTILDESEPQLALLPEEDEGALEPARVVPFEESWIPRSGFDRRRIARPGPDRRRSID
jgi:hypothetical protein